MNTSSTPSDLRLVNLQAGFGQQTILREINLQLAAGETLVILGESGCGKTTLLRAIAGLIPITTGEIWLANKSLASLPPQQRSVIYLDQEPLLFEHLTVADNIAFAMRMKRVPEPTIQTSVAQILQAIDLTSHAHKREWELSGGQKQRVAFARAVLAQPQLLLLDEPFSSLDSKTRTQMQTLFAELCQRFSLTSLFVTHDVKEALLVGSQFARMSQGKLFFYPTRQAFLQDDATGIPAEIAFWQQQQIPPQGDS